MTGMFNRCCMLGISTTSIVGLPWNRAVYAAAWINGILGLEVLVIGSCSVFVDIENGKIRVRARARVLLFSIRSLD